MTGASAFGRAAVFALCCLLVADESAEARRAHHHRAKATHAPAPVSEFRNKPNPPGPVRFGETRYEVVAFSDIEGWAADDHAAAFATFSASCRALIGGAKTSRDTRPVYPGLVENCRKARAAGSLGAEAARKFFEEHFRPLRISKLEETAGFLTGYYEPVVEGSRTLTDEFKVPVYARPRDLVHMGRKRKAESFPNTGRVVRRLARGKYVPYFDRAQIEDGALATRNLEICYLKDANDLLFAQIQGSARVRLPDGSMLRVNYDAHNGQPYTPVGRILIERGIVPREEMSMDRIRKWMAENPDGGKELRRQNKSYVFFRNTGLPENEEARGAQGVPLTASRSIAVDRQIHVYGTPFFISGDLPIATDVSASKFRKLMIAQDTGSAIVGPARADIYFGSGEEAGRIAGRIKNPAQFVMLMPNALDPVEAGKKMPLPEPRPASAPKAPPDAPNVAAKPDTKPVPETKATPDTKAATAAPEAAVPLPPDRPLAGPVPLPPDKPLAGPVPLPPDKPMAGPVPVPRPRPKS